jgi:hypothetical protein
MPSRNDFGKYALKKLEKKYNSGLINGFMYDLNFLVDSGYYIKLFDVYSDWEEPVPLNSEFTHEIACESELLVVGVANLKNIPISFLSDLIDYNTFIFFLPFLEWVYSMNLGRKLISDDVRRLFASDLAERIVFTLEDFDTTKETFKVTPEFFQELREVKWDNKKTKKIFNELNNILSLFAFENYGFKESSFKTKQEWVVLFLAGCSALKENRQKITTEDVLMAYKTIFKIIKTDISKLI